MGGEVKGSVFVAGAQGFMHAVPCGPLTVTVPLSGGEGR